MEYPLGRFGVQSKGGEPLVAAPSRALTQAREGQADAATNGVRG